MIPVGTWWRRRGPAPRDLGWSEEWKRECEIAYLAGMKPDKLRAMLYGVQGAEGEHARGIKQHRGAAAVEQLVCEIEQYKTATG